MNVGWDACALAVVVFAGRKVRHFVVTDPRFTLARPDQLSRGLSMAGIAHASRNRHQENAASEIRVEKWPTPGCGMHARCPPSKGPG